MSNNSKYITLTDENFREEVLESKEPVVVDFWAEWCAPCHMIAPAIEEIAEEYKGNAKIGKLDVDSNTNTAAHYGIRSIPTLLFFNEGKIVQQVIGVESKKEITDKIDALLQAS